MKINNLERGRFLGFIPHHLEISNQTHLNIFPLNVLFAQYKVENRKTIMGTALYEPDTKTFTQKKRKFSMSYHNVHGGDCSLFITFDPEKKCYLGTKIINGKNVGMASGTDWNIFFTHFTILGLSNGERCEFREVD